ncbi:MAG: phosphatidylglycerophosphatase A [Piscirickettsiaceae bacterium CG_4_9_14_3_um_filter_43_564]|nr:phosphatidylglycerophosphatase A [Thiomicrospira sp.]OIP95230.1 MAG: phosphatidylglycerophosphatase A [Thiomicrospira sp. CG2_30_44_34]PIQ03916.1 MAG: phosphatidylglycerophosphatase A [Piscirickettsiaceae bacterium CG18_big_fil_WC_8_21_14_2_50_44_103]PIU38470.1 MAG: phosphatidylglycerophosphatase A [Piscirickettsiaceae bacterium CG07_land_8_20_14_0_80_44_28]PIW57890.1 MAG: phosphatidylglycerophosphatase A [Piscirickettsiaceae bacterium CG12_big_fil_rev_8_21_14_0_65_44_934]PIW77453.1 MAG: ph
MHSIPTFRTLLKHPVMLLGFGFGSGLSPKAPGTVGTLLGLVLFIPLLVWLPLAAWALLVAGTLMGAAICGRSAQLVGVHDHGGIVWDEFIGIWMVLVCLPEQSWLYWGLAFVTFRVFDIFKPWPIRWADESIGGGLGILLDDIMAACYAIMIIWGLQTGFL